MKRFLPAFFFPLSIGLLVALAGSLWTRMSKAPPDSTEAATRGKSAVSSAPAIGAAKAVPEKPAEGSLARWEKMSATPEGLVRADQEIRALGVTAFPGICEDAMRRPESAKTALLRLLCIRWAEMDGQAALEWAHSRFRRPEGEEWREWLNDLAGTWFSAHPAAAADWFSKLMKSPERREAWAPQGGHFAFESWTRPGNVVHTARAKLAGMNPAAIYSETPQALNVMSPQVTTLAEIKELRKMVEEFGSEWPRAERQTDGVVGRSFRSRGHPGLTIAAVYEQAWPRIDPEGWRAYAAERVIGATGDHLLLELAVEDCKAGENPAETARTFLQTPAAEFVDDAGWVRLANTVEDRAPGAGWELLRDRSGLGAERAAAWFARDRYPEDLEASMAVLGTMTDSAVREKAEDQRLLGAAAKGADVQAWMEHSGWSPDRRAAFHEMLVSEPLR